MQHEPESKAGRGSQGRVYVSQSDVPRHSLVNALRVAQVIEDHYGGVAASPFDVATSLNTTPSSSWFRTVTGAAMAFGLTEGAYNSSQIRLTKLGRTIVAPTDEGEDRVALREALFQPRVMREFLAKYDRRKVPPENIARNVLVALGVDREATQRTLAVIVDSARHAGVLRSIKGDEWIDVKGAGQRGAPVGPTADIEEGDDQATMVESEPSVEEFAKLPSSPKQPGGPKPIFLGHGKKRGPLEKLQKILDSFRIPYKVALDEPNLGRPIPIKVKNVMGECGSAILLFTKDECFFDGDGGEVWRPSENVVFELGAASYEYDDRVVVFMEKGLKFPANYESIGHIDFEEESIDAKTTDLLRELVGLGLLKVTPVA